MKRMYASEGQQRCNGVGQLMGEGFDDFDVLADFPVHDRKHNRSGSEPQKPWIIAALAVAKPFRQVAYMVR